MPHFVGLQTASFLISPHFVAHPSGKREKVRYYPKMARSSLSVDEPASHRESKEFTIFSLPLLSGRS